MSPEPCVQCARPGTLFCPSCAQHDDDNVLTQARWYCSPLCKDTDEPNHKTECHDSLVHRAERAGDVAQALFNAFIQDTWAHDMSNIRIVRDQDAEIVAIEVIAGPGVLAGPGRESACTRFAGGWLIKFPAAAFEEADQVVRRAVLADRNSIWGFVFMHAVVQALFKDLVDDVEKDIKEIVHHIPGDVDRLVEYKGRFGLASIEREDIVYPDVDANGNLKGIYSIMLKDGTRIALDLAGAQYNLPHTTVMHWSSYLSRWGNSIKYRVPFRSHYDKHIEKMSTYRCITHLTVIMEQTVYFNTLATHSKAELGYELKDLLTMDEEDFTSALHQLTDQAHEYLLERPREIDEGLLPRCLTDKFDLRHPKVVANLPQPSSATSPPKSDLLESLPRDIGDMELFDWDTLRKLIQMPSSQVRYQEKKKAKTLLAHRCAYKMPRDWKLVFLQDTLPSMKVPVNCVSENPYWKRR